LSGIAVALIDFSTSARVGLEGPAATGDTAPLAAYASGMSLSQPSRTIVVEPVQAPITVPAPPEPPPAEAPRRVEAPAAPGPPAQSAARP
jgi:hypothetical protein